MLYLDSPIVPVGTQSLTSMLSERAGALEVAPPAGAVSVTTGAVPSAMNAERYQSEAEELTLATVSVGLL